MPRSALLVVLSLTACATSLHPATDVRPIRPASECSEVVQAFAADRTFGEYRPPAVLRLVLPDHITSEPHEAQVRVTVAASGKVNSVEVTGTEHKQLIAAIRRSAKQFRFRPATVDDCAVVGWHWYVVTTGRP